MSLIKVVALCNTGAIFGNNKIFNREFAVKYPGALASVELKEKLSQHGIDIVTGDIALKSVKTGEIKANQILIIENDNSPESHQLIAHGAKPKILICGESPLFADDFYTQLSKRSIIFDHCVVFKGATALANPKISTQVLYFPSYSEKYTINQAPWHDRGYLVMVAANKYWEIRRTFLRKIAANIKDIMLNRPQRISHRFNSDQLHDERLFAIEFFSQFENFQLFGRDWNNLSILPKYWEKKLEKIICDLSPVSCENKIDTISNFKYCLCYENMKYPGYITEKIIDAFVAGTVPIYLGASDVEKYIPENCYIDIRKFNDYYGLKKYIDSISETQWINLVQNGRDFLISKEGRHFTYQSYAESIFNMLVT
jgi:hypothetical protein